MRHFRHQQRIWNRLTVAFPFWASSKTFTWSDKTLKRCELHSGHLTEPVMESFNLLVCIGIPRLQFYKRDRRREKKYTHRHTHTLTLFFHWLRLHFKQSLIKFRSQPLKFSPHLVIFDFVNPPNKRVHNTTGLFLGYQCFHSCLLLLG